MQILIGRERKVFDGLAAALLERTAVSTDDAAARVRSLLSRSTLAVRIFFRLSLFLLEWGTLFLATGSGRFEHFTRLPSKARRRYLRLWTRHKIAAIRHVFLFLKLLTLAAIYDDREEARRVGYAPKWLC